MSHAGDSSGISCVHWSLGFMGGRSGPLFPARLSFLAILLPLLAGCALTPQVAQPTPSPSPIGATATVYVGADGVYALRGSDGTQRWHYATQASPYLAPPSADGTLYVGADGAIQALDAVSGHLRWSHLVDPKAGPLVPLAAGNTIYAGACIGSPATGAVYAFQAAGGAPLWAFPTPRCVSTAPALADGALYVSAADGSLYALRASDGVQLWRRQLPPPILPASPVAANGMVYVGSMTSVNSSVGLTRTYFVVALRASDGTEIWRYRVGVEMPQQESRSDSLLEPVAVAGGAVYVDAQDGSIYAVDATTGTLRWHVQLQKPVDIGSPPLALGDTLYVELEDSQGDAVMALTATDGTVRWRSPMAASVFSPAHLTTAGGLLVAESCVCQPFARPTSGAVDAYTVADGAPRWRVKTPVAPVSVVAAA